MDGVEGCEVAGREDPHSRRCDPFDQRGRASRAGGVAIFAGVVGRENVIAGTDCGFAQSYNIVRCHPSVQWAKLESLVEGARLASKDLWGD